ncbi:hypothetical protein C8F04DRAFT_1274146 [Mycena alexandri]|uniref:Uncharacterized protein n=1 Tax=Mycena alexandri TaxID=1745969 RepID=A0AAD6S5S7_9AGAR|nr:hypothetical protein C8F04DRAFT_1274146 [Mycena alexandri]
MPRGRLPLDPETKAINRKESLQRYAANLRASNSEIIVSEGCTPQHLLRARTARAAYREKHRKEIRVAETLRRHTAYLEKNGAEALDERMQCPLTARTQKRHEGRPPRRIPPTKNQRRCRALRRIGFEEDNGEDSDDDIPEGMCGCDRHECQKSHRNETQKRRDCRIFELKYTADVLARM